MDNKIIFADRNPNPIIEINKEQNSISYINSAARALFTTIEKEGLKHPILIHVNELLTSTMYDHSELIIMVKEIVFFNIIYEQQIFSVPENSSIFIYMNNITAYKETEKKANHYIEAFQQQERAYQSHVEFINKKMKTSFDRFKKSKEMYDLALKSANAGTWNWHVISDIFTWDNNMSHLFGLSTSIYSGNFETILKRIHPEDRQHLTNNLRSYLGNSAEFNTNFRIIKSDGSLRYLNFKGSTYSDYHDKVIGLTGICLDMTAS